MTYYLFQIFSCLFYVVETLFFPIMLINKGLIFDSVCETFLIFSWFNAIVMGYWKHLSSLFIIIIYHFLNLLLFLFCFAFWSFGRIYIWPAAIWTCLIKIVLQSLRENCSNMEIVLVRISRMRTEYRVTKYGPEKAPHVDTFHAGNTSKINSLPLFDFYIDSASFIRIFGRYKFNCYY